MAGFIHSFIHSLWTDDRPWGWAASLWANIQFTRTRASVNFISDARHLLSPSEHSDHFTTYFLNMQHLWAFFEEIGHESARNAIVGAAVRQSVNFRRRGACLRGWVGVVYQSFSLSDEKISPSANLPDVTMILTPICSTYRTAQYEINFFSLSRSLW